jgi:hypothetical protein
MAVVVARLHILAMLFPGVGIRFRNERRDDWRLAFSLYHAAFLIDPNGKRAADSWCRYCGVSSAVEACRIAELTRHD